MIDVFKYLAYTFWLMSFVSLVNDICRFYYFSAIKAKLSSGSMAATGILGVAGIWCMYIAVVIAQW